MSVEYIRLVMIICIDLFFNYINFGFKLMLQFCCTRFHVSFYSCKIWEIKIYMI